MWRGSSIESLKRWRKVDRAIGSDAEQVRIELPQALARGPNIERQGGHFVNIRDGFWLFHEVDLH